MITAITFQNLTSKRNSIPLGNLRQIDTFPGVILSYISYIGMCAPKRMLFSRFGLKTDIDLDHLPGMVFKGTTRAYKRMENDMFLSEIESGYKEPCGASPPRILRSTYPPPPPPRTELPLSNISFDTHARINEIKTS